MRHASLCCLLLAAVPVVAQPAPALRSGNGLPG